MALPKGKEATTRDFLSLSHYDDDAASLRSASDQESDSEDDEVLQGARSSLEIAEHDRSVLKEEEEREKLLTEGDSGGKGLRRIFSGSHGNGSRVKIGRRERRRQRRQERKATRRRRKGKNYEEGELMYEMEEGGVHDDVSSASSNGSADLDRQKIQSVFDNKSRHSRCCKFALIYTAIGVLFFMMVLGAYQASHKYRSKPAAKLLSNGTSTFAPTTILISLDGFRADFLQRGLTPTLNTFIEEGVSPRYMLPSFPSVTFPNHFTLVTGLYPESHGVVGNTFWDPELEEEFFYTDPERSMQAKWWQAEPVWNTAEKAGIKSAIHMWPGSEALIGGIVPTFLDKFNATEVLSRKVDRILHLLDMPGHEDSSRHSLLDGAERPQFIAAYVPVVDADGHKYGPNSTEIRQTIKNVDAMLHGLFDGLRQRNLTEIVNVVVVSDHGMSTVNGLIQLDDLIDLSLIEHIDGWPLYGLRPKDPTDLRRLYDSLVVQSAMNPNFEVYLRDENMPERYHFSHSDRIAPLWIIPKTGWAIVKKADFDVEEAKKTGKVYHPRGLHGYDHEHPLMRAIFIARGPAFPHTPNTRLEVFQNVEVYNIICDSLHITPRPNNGTVRLPLTSIGLHSDEESPQEEAPADPPFEGADEAPSEVIDVPTAKIGVDVPDMEPTRPVVYDSNSQASEKDQKGKASAAWWAYIRAKLEAAKAWALDVLSKSKEDESQTDER